MEIDYNSNLWDFRTPTFKRCYETHKGLPIVVGDKTYTVYGGSCSTPIHTNADVFVGLDYSMAKNPKIYPWNGGMAVHFIIKDMGVPDSITEFVHLIEWISMQLIANHKVHIGCIGGHGRTGLVMAALVMHMTGNKDAITYVRSNYCKKAVESDAQIQYLHSVFNINLVATSKTYKMYTAPPIKKRKAKVAHKRTKPKKIYTPEECTYQLW